MPVEGQKKAQSEEERGLNSAWDKKLRREEEAKLWLRRLGFPNPHRVLQMLRDKLATNVTLPKDLTFEDFHIEEEDAYQQGKMRCKPHRRTKKIQETI